jgi:rubredoxin/uncharacterized membrane protein
MKKWKCEVCGYIHEGEAPPDKCPVCGAEKSKFILLEEEEETPSEEAPAEPEPQPVEAEDGPSPSVKSSPLEFVYQQVLRHHLHPISVHIPNGVVPMTVLFLFLSALFGFAGLSKAAFYNLAFVSLSMPLVLATGVVEWQRRYGGAWTQVFIVKLICGALVTLLAVLLAVWLMVSPDVVAEGSPMRFQFLFVNVFMLAAAGIAGHLGGKLVFKE